MSAATATTAPFAWAVRISAPRSRTTPLEPGYWTSTPKTSRPSNSVKGSPTTTSNPNQRARVRTTAMVCGSQSAATKKVSDLDFATRCAMAMASAAAVASSSSEALASSMPVRSQIICWKLSSASRRPWLTSAW